MLWSLHDAQITKFGSLSRGGNHIFWLFNHYVNLASRRCAQVYRLQECVLWCGVRLSAVRLTRGCVHFYGVLQRCEPCQRELECGIVCCIGTGPSQREVRLWYSVLQGCWTKIEEVRKWCGVLLWWWTKLEGGDCGMVCCSGAVPSQGQARLWCGMLQRSWTKLE